MAERIPQSTTIRIPLQAYLTSDHVTPATGKTIAITISKNGAAYANPSAGATNAVEIGSGSYYVDISTTDTGTLGPLFVLGTSSGVDAIVTIYNIVNAVTGGFTGNVVQSGTAQAGSTNTITLASSASATNGLYDPALVRITGGTGAGQGRLIIDYNGTSKVAVVDRDWRTAPDSTSVYDIIAATNLFSTNEGLAQAGAASTITLNASASSVDNTYNGQTVVLRTGTGQDQSRTITSYVGSTKIATVDTAWATNPTSATGYMVYQTARLTSSAIGTVNANTIQLAGQTVTAGAGVTFPGTVASPTNITAGTITTVTNLTNAATAGDFTAVMKTSLNAATPASVTGAVGSVTGNVGGNVVGSVASVTGAVGSVTGNVGGSVGSVVGAVGSVTAAVTVGTNNDKTNYLLTSAYDFAKGTVAMTESYAALGAGLTPAQALYGINQQIGERSTVLTAVTVKKRDRSTTAKTYTLDNAVTPTAITEAS